MFRSRKCRTVPPHRPHPSPTVSIVVKADASVREPRCSSKCGLPFGFEVADASHGQQRQDVCDSLLVNHHDSCWAKGNLVSISNGESCKTGRGQLLEGMIERAKRASKKRSLLAGFFLLCLVAVLSGCQTLGYYKQAIQGECQILLHRQSIEKLLAST